MNYTVQISNLSYRFNKQQKVLNNINLAVPQGSIYGFLGPNGAGKTTTLRLLLGLLKKQDGDILVFNKSFEKNRLELLNKIGSLIESPSVYGHLTAVNNLQIMQKIYGCNSTRIQEVLKIVGLENTGNKKASEFSLGMKQRLSIAIALLHQPQLLILDEPTNGLDPNGIIEIRELLKTLSEKDGTTIIVSSHLLSEIEKLATHVGIISNGSMAFEGTLKSLLDKQQNNIKLIIETNNIETTCNIIRSLNLNGTVEDGKIILPVQNKNIIATIINKLVEQGVEVYELSTSNKDLEGIFLELINSK